MISGLIDEMIMWWLMRKENGKRREICGFK